MQIVHATFQNGTFTPEDSIDLKDGTRVTLRVEVSSTVEHSAKNESSARGVPDFIETEEMSAPYDFPIPPDAEKVKARLVDKVLPDPPIFLRSIQ